MTRAAVAALPSSAGGPVAQTVGWFEADAEAFASWLSGKLEAPAPAPAGWSALADALGALGTAGPGSRRVAVPVRGWTALLTDGPLGTDVGVLPSRFAQDRAARAIRAVSCEPGDAVYPGRIRELYGPGGADPLLDVRTVAAVNDGGRWIFETSGDPLPFEQLERYDARRKADRFTTEMLYAYLRELGVPYDAEPDWTGALVVESR